MKDKRFLVMESSDSYLLAKYRHYFVVMIVEESKLAYKLQFENGSTRWILKDDFEFTYQIVEELI